MLKVLTLALLLACSLTVKVFLFGGILVDDNNPAYQKLVQ
mgnify:CR=1 FL=1